MTRPLRAAAWLAGLAAAGFVLRAAGTGDLAAPPLAAGDLTGWVDGRSPVAAAVALGRLVAELCVWYVLAVSALHVAADVLRRRGAHRLADALALPAVGRLVRAGLGVGLVAASTLQPAGSAAGPGSPPPGGTATMSPLAPDAGGTGGGTATMSVLDAPAAAPAGPAATAPGRGTAAVQPVPAAPAPPPAAPTTWTVSPGESLWSIAEEVLGEAWGRPAADPEVDPYWRALVERNRSRLADPGDPDLLHPGQVLELPPLT